MPNYIGNISQDEIISRMINDFRTKVNMAKSHFKSLPIDVMYFLFKTYCMPLYGSQLCDISCTAIAKFYTAWRKAIRYILNLPRRTHCDLLHLICNDVSIHNQMSKRFVHFFKQIYQSDNSITSFCSRLAFAGSQSSVGNSFNLCI